MVTLGIATLTIEATDAAGCPYCGQVDPQPTAHECRGPLLRRIAERRADNPTITPIAERRVAERRTPRWLTYTRQSESRGKSLDGRAA